MTEAVGTQINSGAGALQIGAVSGNLTVVQITQQVQHRPCHHQADHHEQHAVWRLIRDFPEQELLLARLQQSIGTTDAYKMSRCDLETAHCVVTEVTHHRSERT